MCGKYSVRGRDVGESVIESGGIESLDKSTEGTLDVREDVAVLFKVEDVLKFED